MTDTLANAPPPPTPEPSPGGLSSDLTATVTATPELNQDPASAVAVAASGGNVVVKGQGVAHAVNQAAKVHTARQVQQSSGGLFGDIMNVGKDLASDVGNIVNKPLQLVQHEYRYLHDVEARHGMGAAFEEGLGLAAGAVVGGTAGFFAGGNVLEGATLGAEGAGYLEGETNYKDSWARTANGATYRDPHTGQLVSFGRDLTSAIGVGGGSKKVLSGVLDGVADLAADPVSVVGKVYAGQKTLGLTADNVDRAWHNPLSGFKRATQDIAASDYGTIVSRYPQFEPVAHELAAQTTPEGVRDFMKSLAGAHEIMDARKVPTVADGADGVSAKPLGVNAANLPSLSPAHMPFRALRDAARDAGQGPGFFSRHIMNNVVFGPGRWANRLEAQPGNTLNRATMDLTGFQYDPGSNVGAGDVLKMVRYGQGETAARAVATALDTATEGQRVTIFRNAFFSTLFHMARIKFPEDATMDLTNPAMEDSMLEMVDGKTKQALVTRMENHLETIPHEGSPPGSQYGTTWRGDNIKPFVDPDGVSSQGAITPNQRGALSIPNITEARRMAQAIRQSKTSMFLGGTDDFLYDHVTQGFFKPLVLMSGGYALHISLAELIPNTLRHGLRASISAVKTRALTDLGWKAAEAEKDDREIGGLTGLLYRTLGGSGIRDKNDVKYMIQSYEMNEGQRVPLGLRAGEAMQGETQPLARASGGMKQIMGAGYRQGKRFYSIDSSDPRFADAWHAELAENVNRWSIPTAIRYKQSLAEGKDWEAAAEDARVTAARTLRAEQERGGIMLARTENTMAGAPPTWDGIDGHAQAIVDKLMGAVHARPTSFDEAERAVGPGPVHQDLLDSIANGRIPTREEVQAIDSAQRPLNVKARELVPLHEGGAVQAIANFGFKKFLNPIVNVISRNQEYTIEYLRLRREMQPLVDQGLRSEDEVATEAMARATQHGLRFVHNLHDRTQWTATLRNWAPFFFAQEQAYRRMGRLMVEDPGAFRRYQLMISGVHNLAQNLQDSTGNQYIALPGSGFLGSGVAELMGEGGLTAGGVSPMSLGGSFSSANVIFPLSQGIKPDLGPLAIVPAAQLSAMFTELNRNYAGHNSALGVVANDLSDVAGPQAMNESFWEQIIPNATAQRVLQSAMGDDRAFNSAVMQSYQWAMYQQAQATKQWIEGGRKGPEPELVPGPNATAMQKQQFQDKIRNYTRMNFFVRALVGFMSPVSASVVVQNLGIPGRLQNYITSNGSVALGMQAAHLDHPDWDPWMVSESFVPSDIDQSQSSGFSLSASAPAQQWVTNNQALMDKYGVSALWLMPQLTDAKYDPTIYNEQIAQGLRIKDTPDQFLAALYVNAGNNQYYSALPIHEAALTAAGNSTAAVNAEYDNWNNYVTKLEQQNPVWAEDFLSANKQVNRTNSIKQLHAIFENGDAPPGPMTNDVEFLLNQYDQAAADYQAAGQARTYSQQLAQQKAVSDNWINYVTGVETSMPQLKPIINGVFKEALVVKT